MSGKVNLKKHGRKTTDGVTTVSIGQSRDAEEGDVGFHLIGDQFDGPINLLNVVPGNGVSFKELKSLNLSGYKKWEHTIAELARSRQVSVKIKLVYSAKGRRPGTITAAYLDDDGNWVKKTFENKAEADMDMIKLQEQFIGELLESAPDEWERIEVQYERYAWGGETSEIYIANSFVGSEKTDLDLTLEALESLASLQAHPPKGQAEPWTWLKFVVDDAGRYHFDYQYGVPPLVAREIAAQKG